jgi:hypothetical protein
MPILNWKVFRRECNAFLQGRGNRNWRNAYDLGLHFRIEPTKNISLEIHILPLGSHLLFLTTDAKNLVVSTFQRDERECMRITVQLTISFSFFALYILLILQREFSLVRIMLYSLFFLDVSSATLSKTSFDSIKCLALFFEVKV